MKILLFSSYPPPILNFTFSVIDISILYTLSFQNMLAHTVEEVNAKVLYYPDCMYTYHLKLQKIDPAYPNTLKVGQLVEKVELI